MTSSAREAGGSTLIPLGQRFGPGSRDRSAVKAESGIGGALAALETFYCALNRADLELLTSTWAPGPLVQLDNPVGGVLHGREAVAQLYRALFRSELRLQVELEDIVAATGADLTVFLGREVGSYHDQDRRCVRLLIRTTRVFARYPGVGWAQVHHHGSIDDPEALRRYQSAVQGEGR